MTPHLVEDRLANPLARPTNTTDHDPAGFFRTYDIRQRLAVPPSTSLIRPVHSETFGPDACSHGSGVADSLAELQPWAGSITLLLCREAGCGCSEGVRKMPILRELALGRRLEALFDLGAIRELTDGQLLERFARGEGEAAGLAFAALVERHGAMVMRVCRAQLADPHECHDAFQATFLVLIEKARGLWVKDSLGPWLHQVAVRTASAARLAAIRRRRLERRAAEMADRREATDDRENVDQAGLLHREIDRLPERYRVPIVLCDLEGRTCEEAARVMGCPVGTVKSWRSRGRERLRRRLIGGGLAPGLALEVALGTDGARASAADWTAAAERMIRVATDRMAAGEVPARVAALAKGVLMSMFLSRLRTTAAALGVLAIAGAGLTAAARVDGGGQPAGPDAPPAARQARSEAPWAPQAIGPTEDAEVWRLSLREAIWIGLDNADWVRIIRVGRNEGIGVIAPRSADADIQVFRKSAMARLRAIEQAYWELAAAQVQLWADEKALSVGQQILAREQAELKAGQGHKADVAEASQRLEQFRLEVFTRTSDVITAERNLRGQIGMPLADNRRIVPVSAPCLTEIEPSWLKCLKALEANHPDVLMARRLLAKEKSRARASFEPRNELAVGFLPGVVEADREGFTASRNSSNDESPDVSRQQILYQQALDDATSNMTRAHLKVNSTYKQAQTASKLRASYAKRLETERALHKEGKFAIDRLLDTVSGYATALGTESRYESLYNIALAQLEEARGTLLHQDQIEVAQAATAAPPNARPGAELPTLPAPSVNLPLAPGSRTPSPAQPVGPAPPTPAEIPAAARRVAAPSKRDEARPAPAAGLKTYTFQVSIGSGPRPFEIRGSLTVAPGDGDGGGGGAR